MKRPLVAVLSALAGWGALALALVYFVNGLTRPDAAVQVSIDNGASPQPYSGGGIVDLADQTGTFHYAGLTALTDRIPARLGLCVTLALVGVIGILIASIARRPGPLRTAAFTPSRGSWSLGICIASIAVVPGIAQWVASASVLQSAGAPQGLTPRGSLSLGWLAAGLIYLATVSAFGRTNARLAASGRSRSAALSGS